MGVIRTRRSSSKRKKKLKTRKSSSMGKAAASIFRTLKKISKPSRKRGKKRKR